MSGMLEINALLGQAYRAATMIHAISGLTQSDQCSVPTSVVNDLAEMGHEALLNLIERLSGKV